MPVFIFRVNGKSEITAFLTFFGDQKRLPLLCRKLKCPMKYYRLLPWLTLFTLLILAVDLHAQPWEFIKERDGIKIFTRREPGSMLKSFKGEADLHTSMEQVCNLIGNVKKVDWWDKNLREINVLLYEKDKHIQYYLVYGAPWPVTDRDLCVDATISTDPVAGIRTISSVPLFNVVPENPKYVRIKKYRQKWVIQDMKNGVIHITLEGFVDPAGNVPNWIYNMVITDTPLKIMRGIKARLENKQ